MQVPSGVEVSHEVRKKHKKKKRVKQHEKSTYHQTYPKCNTSPKNKEKNIRAKKQHSIKFNMGKLKTHGLSQQKGMKKVFPPPLHGLPGAFMGLQVKTRRFRVFAVFWAILPMGKIGGLASLINFGSSQSSEGPKKNQTQALTPQSPKRLPNSSSFQHLQIIV